MLPYRSARFSCRALLALSAGCSYVEESSTFYFFFWFTVLSGHLTLTARSRNSSNILFATCVWQLDLACYERYLTRAMLFGHGGDTHDDMPHAPAKLPLTLTLTLSRSERGTSLLERAGRGVTSLQTGRCAGKGLLTSTTARGR